MILTDDLEEKLNQILADPESMAQILSLAQSFGMPAEPPSDRPPDGAPPQRVPPPPPPPVDAAMLQGLMRLMQQTQQADQKQEALLRALKPYLAPERRGKLDRAMQIARISHLVSAALKNYGKIEPK